MTAMINKLKEKDLIAVSGAGPSGRAVGGGAVMVVAPPAPTTPPAPAAAADATRAMMQEMFEGFKSEREAARKEYREDIQDMKNELDAMKAAVMEGRRVAGIAAEKLAASTARQRATEEQLQQERAERGRLQAELDAMRAQAAGRANGSGRRPGDWDCPRCGRHQFAKNVVCFRDDCRCPKPGGGRAAMLVAGQQPEGAAEEKQDGGGAEDAAGRAAYETIMLAQRFARANNKTLGDALRVLFGVPSGEIVTVTAADPKRSRWSNLRPKRSERSWRSKISAQQQLPTADLGSYIGAIPPKGGPISTRVPRKQHEGAAKERDAGEGAVDGTGDADGDNGPPPRPRLDAIIAAGPGGGAGGGVGGGGGGGAAGGGGGDRGDGGGGRGSCGGNGIHGAGWRDADRAPGGGGGGASGKAPRAAGGGSAGGGGGCCSGRGGLHGGGHAGGAGSGRL